MNRIKGLLDKLLGTTSDTNHSFHAAHTLTVT